MPRAAPAGAAAGSSHVLSLISFIKKDNEPVAVSVSVSLTPCHKTCVCLCVCVCNVVL